jgi:hypothetical protein
MARSKDHTNTELANRLEEHANDLTESTWSDDAETIVRLAAERLRCTTDHGPLVLWLAAELKRIATSGAGVDMKNSRRALLPIPKLVSELAKIANTTSDADTQRRLRCVLGEA